MFENPVLFQPRNERTCCRNSPRFGRIAASIKRKYRADQRRGGPVTFREFIQHIIDRRTRRPFDRHWRPFHQLCQPCRIHYDFIGHYETLADDSRYVLRRLGIHDDQFPQPKAVHNSSELVVEKFAEFTESEIDRLVEIYRLDFLLFGYSANISHFQIYE